MAGVFRQIWPGVTLMAVASSVLLLSDLDRREAAGTTRARPRLAVMQWTSTDLLDHTVAGIVEGLRREGFENGRSADIRFYNAAGDAATASLMAKEVTGGKYDLVLTASTLALQAVAAANREGRVPHVFGAVTDPYGAGVGITGPEPDQHPPHLVGVGTFQPVASAIRIAREMNPDLRRLGVVWNPSEDNSAACVEMARKACGEQGMALLEAQAATPAEVAEAVRSVLARKVQAIWIGGDTVAMAAVHAIIAQAREAGVPVFSNDPTDAARGALFGLGAAYQQVGLAVGVMGGRILRGASASKFGVANLVPEVLTLNEAVAAGLPGWSIQESHRALARESAPAPTGPEPGRSYRVGVIALGPNPVFDQAERGIRAALADAGFVEGSNLTVQSVHANSELSMLPQVIRRLVGDTPDVLIPLGTPSLAGTLAAGDGIPVVFGVVTAPLEAGAGESFRHHLAHVTGAVWTAPAPEAFAWMKKLFPRARRLGLMYNPVHANSLVEAAAVRELCGEYGLEASERIVASPAEANEAVQGLLQERPDLVYALGDHTVISALPALIGACRAVRVPVVATDASLMGSGALYSIGASPELEGHHTGRIAARVLQGAVPGDLPFAPSVERETTVDLEAARQLGVALPADFLAEADRFYHLRSLRGRPARIAMINLVQARVLELGERGVERGLRESGLVEGEDYTLQRFNAQGEISQLPALLDAARNSQPDLIVTVTTPAMVAALQRIRDIPVVFTVASDPVALGIFPAAAVPGNVTGVHDDPPVDRLLDMAMEHEPGLESVGILYDPAQPNSVMSVEKLRAACASRGIRLLEATATTMTDLSAGAQSLVQRKAGAFLLSADNLVNSGFAVIQAVATRAGLPIYTTDIDLVEEGATGAIGDDYESWGEQSGRLAARVLAGVPPGALPLESTRTQRVVNPGGGKNTPGPEERPRVREIRIVRYNDAVFAEDTVQGIREGFREAGWQEGVDFRVRVLNAQGDMTTLNSILTAVTAEEPDLIMAISTPALQAALRQGGGRPIVFASVGDAVLAGAGKSETEHQPHVTGITTKSPFAEMAVLIRRMMPEIRVVGTLFTPAEINSELYRQWWAEALAAEGIRLEAVPVQSSAEISEAATALLRRDVQVVVQISDNATRPGYGQIARRAGEAGVPFFCFDSTGLRDGAALALARDFTDTGKEAARVAMEVLGGRSPGEIPFRNTRTETLAVNSRALARHGLALPAEYRPRSREYHED